MTTIAEALASATQRLKEQGHHSSSLEAALLLCHVIKKPRTHLFAWPEKELAADELKRFTNQIEQRLSGKPVAYILGHREFWSLDLKVNSDTLIPRPDTERLVEIALQHIPQTTSYSILDLGTGSGTIAAAIASERPKCKITATDASKKALATAEANFSELGLKNITCQQGNWYQAITAEERFHLIVSNPPYIPEDDPHLSQGDLRYEPRAALASGPDGLNDIHLIAAQAQDHLYTAGLLILEHGYDQGPGVRAILKTHGFDNIETYQDLSGNDRVTMGCKANH